MVRKTGTKWSSSLWAPETREVASWSSRRSSTDSETTGSSESSRRGKNLTAISFFSTKKRGPFLNLEMRKERFYFMVCHSLPPVSLSSWLAYFKSLFFSMKEGNHSYALKVTDKAKMTTGDDKLCELPRARLILVILLVLLPYVFLFWKRSSSHPFSLFSSSPYSVFHSYR